MTEFRRDTPAGRARAVGPDLETCAAAVELCARLAGEGRVGRALRLDAGEVWVKAGALRGKSRLRHGARALLLRRPPPRAAEYHNLRWLARHLFRVPRPVAAVSFWRGALPAYQALLLELVPGARPLHERLPELAGAERDALLAELAREAARMHALGFAHRDLYLRNVLVRPAADAPGDPRRLVFLDAWSGGPRRGARGAPRDLACLLLEGANLLARDEQLQLLERYLAERAAQGRPAARESLLARTASERARLLRRIAREPARWRLSEPPRAWAWPDPGRGA